MFAVRLHEYGGPEVLSYEEIPAPAPGPGQVLIEIGSAAVNFADLMRRRNDPYPFPTPLPFVPGGEVAGTVSALGEGTDGPPHGTPVFALLGEDGSSGYAQYGVADARQVIPIPPGIGEEDASTLIVAGCTAMLTLRQAAGLQPGEAVLIHGAAGGVGSFAIQLAKVLGAGRVIAAASTPQRREHALALGADAAVDPGTAGWTAEVRELTGGRGPDVALEMTGGDVFAQTLSCLAPFGRMVVSGLAGGRPPAFDAATLEPFFYDPAPNQSLVAFNLGLWFGLRGHVAQAALGELMGHVASGAVKVPVGTILPLADAVEAHRMLEERRVTGKIVLKPWASGERSPR